jgi:hypothetical protein
MKFFLALVFSIFFIIKTTGKEPIELSMMACEGHQSCVTKDQVERNSLSQLQEQSIKVTPK